MNLKEKNHIKTVLECAHLALMMAAIVPAMYMTQKIRIDEMLYPLFWSSFVLLVPIVILQTAARKCKNAIGYLATLVSAVIISYAMASVIRKQYLYLNVKKYYVAIMLCLAIVAGIVFFCARLQSAARRQSAMRRDRSWTQESVLADKPRFLFALWFLIIYIWAQMFACPQVCNIALFSGIVYFVMTMLYTYVVQTETYIELNKKTCQVKNIPYKRISRIGRGFLLLNVVLVLLAMIPAFESMNYRTYTDMREWQNTLEPENIIYPPQELSEGKILLEESEKTLATKLMEAILGVIGAVLVMVAVALVLTLVYAVLKQFGTFSEDVSTDSDRIETLEEDEMCPTTKRHVWAKEADHKVRRVYRKYIRKHRKEIPAVYETPLEIETAAGIAHISKMKELHAAYEMVRYSSVHNAGN